MVTLTTNLLKAGVGGSGRQLLFSASSSAHSLIRVPNLNNSITYPHNLFSSSLSFLSTRTKTGRTSFCTATDTNAAAGEEIKESEIKDAANLLDIRVGRILRAWRHEEADSLYVEEVDVGEAEPRIICSGLVNYIPLQNLQDIKVVVLANLKPRNMRGVKSFGMLMAASDASHQNVELLIPPEDSIPGERIWFGSPLDKQNQPPPATPNQVLLFTCFANLIFDVKS